MENNFLQGCLTAFLVFIFMIIGSTLCGALVGWVVGWFFSTPILAFLSAIGITGFKMWEIGAVLGFVGSFFRSSVVNYPNLWAQNAPKQNGRENDNPYNP